LPARSAAYRGLFGTALPLSLMPNLAIAVGPTRQATTTNTITGYYVSYLATVLGQKFETRPHQKYMGSGSNFLTWYCTSSRGHCNQKLGSILVVLLSDNCGALLTARIKVEAIEP